MEDSDCTLGEIASLLKQLRTGRRISRRQLADGAGVHRSVVDRAEQGRDAQLTTWIKLFYALGYEIMIDYCETCEEANDLLADEADRRLERKLDALWDGRWPRGRR